MDLRDRQFVILGAHHELEEVTEAADCGNELLWTIYHKAKVGDGVLFYLLRPVSALVAVGVVQTIPVPKSNKAFPDHYWVQVGDIEMLSRHITRTELRSNITEFGYMYSPIKSYLIPDEIGSQVSKLITQSEEEETDDLSVGDRVEYRLSGRKTKAEGVVVKIDVEDEVVTLRLDGQRKLEQVPFGSLIAIIDES